MPAYNFKERFAGDVEAGRKTQTIRPKRKNPTKSGQHLKLYTGMRTRECRPLDEGPCLSVQDVEMSSSELAPGIYLYDVKVGGVSLSPPECWELARQDGFETFPDFIQFFVDTYDLSPDKPLTGMELIKWEPSNVAK